MTDNIIELRDVTYYYEGSKVPSLDNVSLGIRRGARTVILGANGAGKSTLFYHFNGVAEPAKGTVLFDGQPIKYKRRKLRELRSRIAVVLQNPDDQIFGQTVEADIAYGPSNIDLPKEEVDARVEEALFLTGLTELRDKNTLKLSYGQRKRLALAGALAMRPEVLVLDEPTAGLDPQMAQDFMELAERLHHDGTDVIISTHDVDLAYTWAEDIHVLREGTLVYSGDPDGFYGDDRCVLTSGVMQPSIFAINRGYCAMRGIDEAPRPRTEAQFVSKVSEGPRGMLTIVPVDAGAALQMPEIPDGVRVGVFGTDAKALGRSMGRTPDFMFGGFDACATDCLRGHDSVLLCDRGCLEMVSGKVALLGHFGPGIESRVLRAP
ncbi:MAG: ABC transporter ATP-binding protein [Thermoplasmata archaeon]|nr:ABC transporter ATP-binding protein [Thermoplasmata archaeon]